MNLARKTIIGIICNFAELIGQRGIGLVITLLLARFLAPADYGLVAMMAVFLAVADSLMDSGFKQALIRLEEAGQVDFNTAFYSNIGLGTVSYALLFFTAPLIAEFYQEPRLNVLIRVSGLSIISHSFEVVQVAILSRELNFKAQLQATIPAGLISGLIALCMAYTKFGVWALIAQIHLSALVKVLFLWWKSHWRPSKEISIHSFKKMYVFGYKMFFSSFLEIVFQNLYVIVIARLFAVSIAGYYFFANKIRDLVTSQVVGSIQNVTYPALASMQGDASRLKAGYRKVVQITTFILFPVMLILAALAEPLFSVLFHEKWLPAVPYLQLLCIAGIMHPLHVINLNILKVKGRSDLYLHLEIIKKIMGVIVLVGSIRYGVFGILIGQIIVSVLSYIPNSLFASQLIHYTVREQLSDFLPNLGISTIIALLIASSNHFLSWTAAIKLMSFSAMALILYVLSAYFIQLKSFCLAKQMLLGRKR